MVLSFPGITTRFTVGGGLLTGLHLLVGLGLFPLGFEPLSAPFSARFGEKCGYSREVCGENPRIIPYGGEKPC